VLGLLIAYYAVPVSTQDSTSHVIFGLLLTLVGITMLGWAIVGQIKRQLKQSGEESIPTLLMLLGLVAVVFAMGYFLLKEHSPGEMVGVSTRTDALYFTVSTLTTVGYGDVHAEGQIARALVILQLLFDVVFVGAAVSTLVRSLRTRAGVQRKDYLDDPTR
jgi:hypothetical protein